MEGLLGQDYGEEEGEQGEERRRCGGELSARATVWWTSHLGDLDPGWFVGRLNGPTTGRGHCASFNDGGTTQDPCLSTSIHKASNGPS